MSLALCLQGHSEARAKPHMMPPDIIGEDVRNHPPHGTSSLGLPPEQQKWIQPYPSISLVSKIDPASEKYFPEEAQLPNLQKRWYHTYLATMGEASFRTIGKRDTLYRFLWIRSFHHPICVSIKIVNNGNGGAILHAVELDGADTYGTPIGKQIRNFSHRYFPKLTKELIAKIESSKFWTIPVHDDPIQPTKISAELLNTPLGKSGPIGARFRYPPILCRFDGAQWVMEGLKDGKYRLVRRFSPQESGFRDLCVTFLLLAGLYPKEAREIY